MPLPKPIDNENKSAFIGRCMEDTIAKEEFPDVAQRIAVCNTQWDTVEGKSTPKPPPRASNDGKDYKSQNISTCMRDPKIMREYPAERVREAYCNNQWDTVEGKR
jgi:hypothetical protein